jgi:hypothetical protein
MCNLDVIKSTLRQIFDRKITWKMTIWKAEAKMGVYYKDASYRDPPKVSLLWRSGGACVVK